VDLKTADNLIVSKVDLVPSDDLMLNAWSHSRLTDFEKCPYMEKLKYVDRIPEPPRPLPPGKTEHANDRGSRVHDAAERYVMGGIELIPELKSYQEQFEQLRMRYAEGKVSLEGEWGVDKEWNPVGWKSQQIWGRVKLDAMCLEAPDYARVIDYKTGRKSGNEIKHGDQGQIYQLSTFMRYPDIKRIQVEFWYVDQGVDEMTKVTYTKEQGIRFLKSINTRANKMTNCTEFKPNPNVFSCRWCPYSPRGTGHCPVGV
jgi:hypothetical protein